MKLWIDDVRPAPDGYIWCLSVDSAKNIILYAEAIRANSVGCRRLIDLIDMDHDAGEYSNQGGDYIKLLDWLEETERSYPIRIHSANPVGVANIRRIIERNGWKEIR